MAPALLLCSLCSPGKQLYWAYSPIIRNISEQKEFYPLHTKESLKFQKFKNSNVISLQMGFIHFLAEYLLLYPYTASLCSWSNNNGERHPQHSPIFLLLCCWHGQTSNSFPGINKYHISFHLSLLVHRISVQWLCALMQQPHKDLNGRKKKLSFPNGQLLQLVIIAFFYLCLIVLMSRLWLQR